MKRGILIALLLIVIISLGYTYHSFRKGKAIQYVDDCEKALLATNRTYVICCEKEGKLYLCNDKRVFKPGEYVGIQVNLQKLNEEFANFHAYQACAYQDFPMRDTPLPKKYSKKYIHAENISGYKSFVCSTLFFREEYHHLALSGYVEPIRGNYTLAKVWLFPPGNYRTTDDFKNNLDKAKLVFELHGVIE